MLMKRKFLIALLFAAATFTTFILPAETRAKGNEYNAVVKHLKTRYQAKKVKIPFIWLARFAVGIVRPAGVKSFSVTLFQDLKFSRETLDQEMKGALKNSFSPDWSPIFHVRSREGQQVYMYMREDGENVKLMLVTIDKTEAAVIRATFKPEKLAEFINDPKIFGISLNDNNQQAENKTETQKEN
jgi:hypothetical protein